MFVTLLDHRAKSLRALARCIDVIHDSRHVGRGSQEVIQEVVERNLIFGLWGQGEIGEREGALLDAYETTTNIVAQLRKFPQ